MKIYRPASQPSDGIGIDSTSPLPDREELIKQAEDEVLAIETKYEQTVLGSSPIRELSDISENSEQVSDKIDLPIIKVETEE